MPFDSPGCALIPCLCPFNEVQRSHSIIHENDSLNLPKLIHMYITHRTIQVRNLLPELLWVLLQNVMKEATYDSMPRTMLLILFLLSTFVPLLVDTILAILFSKSYREIS